MIKERLKKFAQSDGLIITVGVIAGILLLSNLLFSSYTLLKQNMVVQRDVERMEKLEERLTSIEESLDQLKIKEVE